MGPSQIIRKIVDERATALGLDSESFLSMPLCEQRKAVEGKTGKPFRIATRRPTLLTTEEVIRQLDGALSIKR